MQCSVESVTRLPETRVLVIGELDLVVAPQLRAAVTHAIAAGSARVLLDLTDTTDRLVLVPEPA